MANTTPYTTLLHELYELIYNKLERRDEVNFRFARKTTSQEVLGQGFLRRFFQSLSSPESSSLQHFGISESTFIQRIQDRHLFDFLANLIFAKCSQRAAKSFVKTLVVPNEWPLLDANDLVILRKSEEVIIQDSEVQRMPYVEEEYRGEGAYGRVHRVLVARGYFVNRNANEENENTTPINLARKDYLTTNDYAQERETIGQVLGSTTKCDNILRSLGSLQTGRTYSLFMPLAECDLQAFMFKRYPAGPSKYNDKADIIRCAIGLANGLDYLHNHIRSPHNWKKLVCYHMDLKPSNVLVFENPDGSRTWKLSDFGMSRVREVREAHRGVPADEKEKDFDRLFKRQPRDLSAPATINRRGEGTYLAPESTAGDARMNTKSDIWSMGCVLSEIFVYLEEGKAGVQSYADAREIARDARGSERFFVEGRFLTSASLDPAVKEQHRELVGRVRAKNAAAGGATKFILRYLEKSRLDINPKDRDAAGTLMQHLQETFEAYNALGEMPDNVEDPPSRRRGILDILNPFSSSSEGVRLLDNVRSWPLDTFENFQGCAISPSATNVVYWTRTKLSFYMPQPTLPPDRGRISMAASHALRTRTNRPNQCWRSVAVTDKFLAASVENSGHLQCYIFNLQGPPGTPIGPNFHTSCELTLLVPEIRQLTLSPGGELLACMVENERPNGDSGSIYYARVEALIEYARAQTKTTLSTPTSTSTLEETIEPWAKVPLPWPARDITELSFPSNERIAFVVQKERTYASSENSVELVSLSLKSKAFSPISIVGPQSDVYNAQDRTKTVALLTAWANYRHEHKCAVITHEKELHIQSFHRLVSAAQGQKRIDQYRISKLIMDNRDRMMFALGTESLRSNLLLLGIPTHQPNNKAVVHELKVLGDLHYGDECEMSLSEGLSKTGEVEDARFVLIAALVSDNRPAIYRVGVQNSVTPR
ncbi:hypothetical protein BJ170DRAFT_685390 [Xylariales sp. AK1849]|nr:hypothetical protein BJ170DRAFT_685390 [Xylariales sp. AK1849]